MRVRCSFKRPGAPQCGNEPQDARFVELPHGYEIVALLCDDHCRTFDSLMRMKMEAR